MTDRELMQQALEALELLSRVPKAKRDYADRAIAALRERLAQPETVMAEYKHQTYAAYKTDGEMKIGVLPEPVIDKSAARRIATVLGWVPPGDTSTERVDETAKQRQEQEPVAFRNKETGEFCTGGFLRKEWARWTPLYTAPPKTEQEPLCSHDVAKTKCDFCKQPEPVAKWDASAPLVVHPHPAFQAAPQRREWVGLTAAEFRKAVDGLEDLEDCWVALEHALKEKNNG
jgi:hypothetical protein